MADTTRELPPIERLQPCLLDRLADDEPQAAVESRTQRVISPQKYRAAVLRDLEWLLNASSSLATPGRLRESLQAYPEVERSVLNFGTRQLSGLTAPETAELERQLEGAIRFFEPRLLPRTVVLHADRARDPSGRPLHTITLELAGELWANPVPEHLFVRTEVDLETGQCLLGDASHG